MLDCFICTGKLSNAVLCPGCSKLACHSCMINWIEGQKRQQCPHCRRPLTREQLVQARFLDDLQQYVEGAKATSRAMMNDPAGQRTCLKHGKPFELYCSDCDDLLCKDCALLSSSVKHDIIHHTVCSIQEYQDRLRSQLLPSTRHRLFLLNEEMYLSTRRLEDALSKLESDKKSAVDYLKQEYLRSCELVHSRYSKHKSQLSQLERSLSQSASSVLRASEGVNLQLQCTDAVEYHRKLKHDLDELKTVEARIKEIKNIDSLGQVDVDLIPPYKILKFEIAKRRLLDSSQGGFTVSPILGYCGMQWRLKLVNNSTNEGDGKFLSAFVQLVSSTVSNSESRRTVSQTWNKFQFFVLIQGLCRRESIAKYLPGESWGFSRFISTAELDVLECDSFRVSFGVRHLSHRDLSHSQNLYIEKLEGDREKAASQLTSFREKLQKTLIAVPVGIDIADQPRELSPLQDVLASDALFSVNDMENLGDDDYCEDRQDSLRISDLDVETDAERSTKAKADCLLDSVFDSSPLNQSIANSDFDDI